MGLPVKPSDAPPATSDNQSSIPWAIQQQLLQQYGHLMLEKMMSKQGDGSTSTVTATATTDAGLYRLISLCTQVSSLESGSIQ